MLTVPYLLSMSINTSHILQRRIQSRTGSPKHLAGEHNLHNYRKRHFCRRSLPSRRSCRVLKPSVRVPVLGNQETRPRPDSRGQVPGARPGRAPRPWSR
jgi:hypothetical protein